MIGGIWNKWTLLHGYSAVMSYFCSTRKAELGFLIMTCGKEDPTTKLCLAWLYSRESSLGCKKECRTECQSLNSVSLNSHSACKKLYDFAFLTSVSLLLLLLFFRAVPEGYGGSQARGRTGDVAASIHHSHSNKASEPHL